MSESPLAEPILIHVNDAQSVSGLALARPAPRAVYVFAHGAGAGMAHPFMGAVAAGLAESGVATLRYQFPFMERGSKRVDAPALAHATVRAAVAQAALRWPGVLLVAGGKSFGGRMTSQAQAAAALPGVAGLGFIGFPLHPAGKPGSERGAHLFDVHLPMLFLQGTRDELADLGLLESLTRQLGARATLALFEDADHAFHVPARSGRKDSDVLAELLDAFASWVDSVADAERRAAPR
jgi:uncharacterized protein